MPVEWAHWHEIVVSALTLAAGDFWIRFGLRLRLGVSESDLWRAWLTIVLIGC